MNIRVTDKETIFLRRVTASLFLQGQLEKSTVSALVREALRVYLNSVWVERDVFVAKPVELGLGINDWPMLHGVEP